MAQNSPAPVDFKALFEKSPGLYLVLDPDLRIVAASDAYCHAMRIARDAVLGLNVLDVFPENPDGEGANAVAEFRASIERVFRLRRSDSMPISRYDIRLPPSEGGGRAERHWSPRNVPILDDAGEIRWIVHRVYDVTSAVTDPQSDEARRRLARNNERLILELQRSNEELAQVDALRSALLEMSRLSTMAMMASALAHDVSQPLTAAKNYLSALKRGGSPTGPKPEELLGKLAQQIDRAGDIVKTLRGYMSAGTTVHRREDVGSVVADAVRLFESAVRRADATLAVAVAPELPAVPMDRTQVQQVLVNLVTNAAQAVTGRERREIALTARLEENALRFDVADTGPGLPEDVGRRLFEPFASTTLIGMGLGLPISRQIVSEHKGTLWVSPNTPKGTVVSFTLALDPASAKPA
ncbi:MAG: ATP-binding protein [Rhizomicrobium sp.]